jgi:CheY-like chemotaxis protein
MPSAWFDETSLAIRAYSALRISTSPRSGFFMKDERMQAALESRIAESRSRYQRRAARKPRVLLVEDDPVTRRSAARWLGTAFDVTAVSNAEHALLLFRPRAFAAVITDHRMAAMTGIELLEQLRIRDPQVLRVLTSGSAIPGIEGYLGAGIVHRFVRKPADLRAALVDLIAAHTERS